MGTVSQWRVYEGGGGERGGEGGGERGGVRGWGEGRETEMDRGRKIKFLI